MAQRRQDAFELKLKEKAFLTSAIKPIVGETTTFKPPVPYVLREVKRGMDKGIFFKDNTYGLGGAPGVATMTSSQEYDNWDQWAQTPAGNVAEQEEGLANYVKSLTLNAYVSEFGTQEERNEGRSQETLALSFIHMETFSELDELRRETMMTTTTAFAALKQSSSRGSAGAGSAMRAEKPEKMVADMQTLELIDELKTRKNGDDMSWDGFKHILGSYPGIKTKFNNYLNKHEMDAVWRARTQPDQVKEFISEFLDSFDDPGVRAKESVERALRFRQKSSMTTATYLEIKELRFDEALREGNTAGHVDSRIREEAERCRNAVDHLLVPIETAVRDHITDVSLAGHVITGYEMDHFTQWSVMAKQVRRLAIHKRLDPKSSSSVTPYGKSMMKIGQDSESESEHDVRKNDRITRKNDRWKNREARVAQDGGGGERRGPMLCSSLPNQSAFKQGDDRVMPPRRPGGPPNNFCVYHWHEVGCKKKGSCVYGGHVTKVDYDKDSEKYKNMDFSKSQKKAPKDQANVAAPAQTSSLDAKFESMMELVKNISAAQQESSAAVMEFKKKQVSVDLEAQKESARRKARHEARAASNASGGSAYDQSYSEQLSFMAGDESDGDS